MINDLVRLHLECGLYNGFSVEQETWVPKIVKMLSEDTETKYLADLYLNFLGVYKEQLRNSNRNPTLNSSVTGVSRTVDLPYLGREVIRRGKA